MTTENQGDKAGLLAAPRAEDFQKISEISPQEVAFF
jgi:hypothetical protein